MRPSLLKLLAVPLAIAVPVAVAGVTLWPTASSTGLAPESMRPELTRAVLAQWSVEGAQAAKTTPAQWAARMKPMLAKADIAHLEEAASAPDLVSMNRALLAGRPASKTATGAAAAKLGTAGSDLVYTPITPCRIVDTRLVGGPLAAGATRSFKGSTTTTFTNQGGAGTNCNLPENVSAITVKITASRPLGNGYLTAYPANEAQPLASSLNYVAGVDTSNESHFKLCRPGCADDFSVFTFQQTDVVIDVNGYFAEPVATELDCTVAQQTGALDLLSGLQARQVSCPAGYSATGGGCGGPLGIAVSNSSPLVTAGRPTGWRCDLVGSLLSVVSYQVSATCCRLPGR